MNVQVLTDPFGQPAVGLARAARGEVRSGGQPVRDRNWGSGVVARSGGVPSLHSLQQPWVRRGTGAEHLFRCCRISVATVTAMGR